MRLYTYIHDTFYYRYLYLIKGIQRSLLVYSETIIIDWVLFGIRKTTDIGVHASPCELREEVCFCGGGGWGTEGADPPP